MKASNFNSKLSVNKSVVSKFSDANVSSMTGSVSVTFNNMTGSVSVTFNNMTGSVSVTF